MTYVARHKARIFKLDVIGAFLQEIMRSRVFVALPKLYGEVFLEFQE
jgi:hypothetical protein